MSETRLLSLREGRRVDDWLWVSKLRVTSNLGIAERSRSGILKEIEREAPLNAGDGPALPESLKLQFAFDESRLRALLGYGCVWCELVARFKGIGGELTPILPLL